MGKDTKTGPNVPKDGEIDEEIIALSPYKHSRIKSRFGEGCANHS